MWNYHHRRCRHVIVPFRYPFSGQVQVQQQLSQEEYAAMQERENAIAQLEVSEAQRELRAQEELEMRQLENDITKKEICNIYLYQSAFATQQSLLLFEQSAFLYLNTNQSSTEIKIKKDCKN